MKRIHKTGRAHKIIFCISPATKESGGVPVLTFMIPEAAWDYMRGGLCHDFELTNVGMPLKVLIARCKDQAEGLAVLQQAAGGELRDLLDVDFSTDPQTRQ